MVVVSSSFWNRIKSKTSSRLSSMITLLSACAPLWFQVQSWTLALFTSMSWWKRLTSQRQRTNSSTKKKRKYERKNWVCPITIAYPQEFHRLFNIADTTNGNVDSKNFNKKKIKDTGGGVDRRAGNGCRQGDRVGSTEEWFPMYAGLYGRPERERQRERSGWTGARAHINTHTHKRSVRITNNYRFSLIPSSPRCKRNSTNQKETHLSPSNADDRTSAVRHGNQFGITK